MTDQVLEGTWEEIERQARKFAGRRVRLLVLEDDVTSKPNQKALDVIKKIRSKQKNFPFTSGEKGVDIVRRGRDGDMFGIDE